jgi:hypothetical protein
VPAEGGGKKKKKKKKKKERKKREKKGTKYIYIYIVSAPTLNKIIKRGEVQRKNPKCTDK